MSTYLPDKRQIALALSLVRLKPPTLTIRDYFENLKSTIVCTARTCPRCQNIRPEEYWRTECQRLQCELDKSVASCSLLKSEIRRLNGNNDLQLEQVGPRKRRTSTASGARATKRTKTGSVLGTEPVVIPHGQQIQIVMSSVYDLQQLLGKTRDAPGTQKLTASLCTTASMLTSVLEGHCRADQGRAEVDAESSSTSQPPLQDTLQVLSRVFAILMKGLDDLDLHSANRNQVGSAAYHLINLSSVLFDLFDQACTASTGQGSSRTQEPDIQPEPLVHTLELMFHGLDPGKQHHANIFEGLMFHLLSRAGRALDHLVPHDPPSPSDSLNVDAKKAALVAASHLHYLLTAAMRLAPRSFRQARYASHTDSAIEPRAGLTIPALTRLQRTLIRAVFGEDADPLDSASDRINLPLAPCADFVDGPSPRRSAKSRGKGKNLSPEAQAEAFIADFWTCLGWETLACEGKMADLLTSWG